MVSSGGTEWHQTNRGVSLYICFYLCLLVVVVILSKFLHVRPRLGSVLPEAAMVILVGITAGTLIRLVWPSLEYGDPDYVDNDDSITNDVAQSLLSFSPTIFFVILLPPIIFNSGYHVQRDLFFRYLSPILLYACVGTIVCTVAVASLLYFVQPALGLSQSVSFLELLAFGALVSATDPVSTLAVFSSKRVDPHLFYLVFGESVLNDAVGLVLFEALAHLIEHQSEAPLAVGQEVGQFFFDFITGLIGSLILGTLFALAAAFFCRLVDLRHMPLAEMTVLALLMYFPFCVAEVLRLSGIVTVLFTGITAQRYVAPQLKSCDTADQVVRLTAHITETIIFLELGLSVVLAGGLGQAWNTRFALAALVACLIGRAINVYPLTALYNGLTAFQERRNEIISKRDGNHTINGTTEGSSEPSSDYIAAEEGAVMTSMANTSGAGGTRVPWNTAHMLWFSGLRGAVSYALVRTFPGSNAALMTVTTMAIVLVTTFFLGGGTEWALNRLGIPTGVDETEFLLSLPRRRNMPEWLQRFERSLILPTIFPQDQDGRKEDHSTDCLATTACGADDHYFEHDPVEMTEHDHNRLVKEAKRLYDYGK